MVFRVRMISWSALLLILGGCGAVSVPVSPPADSHPVALDKMVMTAGGGQSGYREAHSSQDHIQLYLREEVIPKSEQTTLYYPYAIVTAPGKTIALFLKNDFAGAKELDYNRYLSGDIKHGPGFSWYLDRVTLGAPLPATWTAWRKSLSPEQDWQTIQQHNYLGRFTLQERDALVVWLGIKAHKPVFSYTAPLSLEVSEVDAGGATTL